MNRAAIKHIPKSNMAYAKDFNHLELVLQAGKGDLEKVELIIGDPFHYTKVETKTGNEWIWEGRKGPFITMDKVYSTKDYDFFRTTYYTKTKRSKYAFLLYTKGEVYFYGCRALKRVGPREQFENNGEIAADPNLLFNLFDYYNYPYINEEDVYVAPSWVKDTVWYEIFPDRFYPGSKPREGFLPFGSVSEGITNDQFFGGSLKGITEKIPYLKELGITGIYFTPLFEAYSAHKYDTKDYFKIDPQFGTNEDFYNLVQTAHQAGIRVVLDAVFNHCGWDFAFFQDVVKNKKASLYYDCFYIEDEDFINFPLDKEGRPLLRSHNEPLKFRTFAMTPFMPKLKQSHSIIEEYLLNVVRYWMENYHIDGWRLDVCNEVSHSFWRKFRTLVKSINPDSYILGENWDDSTAWLMGDQLDGVMNYELAYPVWQFFGQSKTDFHIDASDFKDLISQLLVRYPTHVTPNLFNLLDSHDTMRILNRMGMNKDLVKLSFVFLFSMSGAPVLYYGTEVGMEGGHDPDCRRCMIWNEEEQDLALLAFFKRLIVLRQENPEMKDVDMVWHYALEDTIIYQKGSLFFLLHKGNYNKEINLPSGLAEKTVKNLIENKKESLGKSLVLNPYQYFIFQVL